MCAAAYRACTAVSPSSQKAEYKEIQADIFSHLVAVVPEFDLRIYQQPTGQDFQVLIRARQAAGPADPPVAVPRFE